MKMVSHKEMPNSRSSLVDHAVESIRNYIRSNNLKAGDRLPGEKAIAQSLQVSCPVLREAISRLECLRLVEVRRGNGTFVTAGDHLAMCVDFVHSALAISPRELMQYAEMRFAIECTAARLCAERATPYGFRQLTELCAAMDRPHLSWFDSVKTEFAFHGKVVELTGNVLMWNFIEALHRIMLAEIADYSPQLGGPTNSSRLYMPILLAIRDGNAELAEAAMKGHLMRHLACLGICNSANTAKLQAPRDNQGQRSDQSPHANSNSMKLAEEIDKPPHDPKALEPFGKQVKGVLKNPIQVKGVLKNPIFRLRDGNSSPRNSCVDRVAESIREYIRSENLQAGDRLPGELAIAQSLHVSRRALREAISRLECLGLVEVRHGTGTFVASRDHLETCVDFVRSALSVSPRDLVQFSEMRLAIECAATRMCAERATPEEVAELTQLCAAIDRPEASFVDSLMSDFAFHRKIVSLTGNILMQNVMEVLQPFVVAALVHTTPQPRDHEHSRRYHEPIVQAIREGNPEEAEATMKRHMVWHISHLPLSTRTVASADCGDEKTVEQLYQPAQKSERSIKARLAAVNYLGEVAKSPNELKVSQFSSASPRRFFRTFML